MKNPFISLDFTSSPVIERTKLQEAWEHFVEGKYRNPEIRPLMLESWQRCLTKGVHPIKGKAPIILPNEAVEEYLIHNPLSPLLEPLLRKLKDVAIDSGHMVVFCNSKGDIVYLDGNVSLRRKAEEMNFIVGSSWAEQNVGTNAIGTALVTGTPLQVFAGEHFCYDVQKWACSAAPIRDPATQEILGVIDLTGVWNVMHPHSLSTVVSTAHSIEERLRHQLEIEQYKILEHYLETISQKPNIPMVALDRGCSVIKASSIMYEQGWIDSKNRLLRCPNLAFPITTKQVWDSEGKNGKWYFELIPYFHENRPIGAIVQVAQPSLTSHKSPIIQKDNTYTTKHSFSSMIGNSPKFQSVITEARSAANTDLPVLIEGESGTGKELLAQSIHSASSRASGPFVAVNCGAIPKELAASEFFGYEEGAFTGSSKGGRAGKFQQADGGTIFLDEIGEMPLDLQTILLRVLEEGEVVRLGGRKPIRLNVRVIAATNKDFHAAIENGKFRRDLYYRLNILSLRIPPLRERPEDIGPLVEHHLNRGSMEVGRAPLLVNKEAMDILKASGWPGNIRELRNFTYRMVTKVVGDYVTITDLPSEMLASGVETGIPHQVIEKSSLKDHELQMILAVLKELNGNVTEAARRLGIHRSTIYRKLGKNLTKKY
jgi:transcriptional regulator of acetoin/glycerol metabolism